jgi:hypothetical protein
MVYFDKGKEVEKNFRICKFSCVTKLKGEKVFTWGIGVQTLVLENLATLVLKNPATNNFIDRWNIYGNNKSNPTSEWGMKTKVLDTR